MRSRSSGCCANCTSCWMRRLPSSSAGCDLPAITNCTGRSGFVRIAVSRSGSRSMSVSRLYVGTRRANPIVRVSGSSTRDTHSGACMPGCCSVHAAARRRRASSTSCRRMRRFTPQNSASESAALLQSACSVSPVPSVDSARPRSAGSVQVGAWTPFVIDVIGTSSESKPGHRSPNMRRLTWPCSFDTPFARWASLRPITAMLNGLVAGSAPGSTPRASASAGSTPGRSERREVPLDERAVEAVDARGHRRVGREHRAGAHELQRLGEREPVGDVRRDALEAEESGVPLVHVEDIGGRATAELGEHAHRASAADAEQQFLQQPMLAAAAVETVGDGAQFVGVRGDVGVQHEQRDATDRRLPHAGVQRLDRPAARASPARASRRGGAAPRAAARRGRAPGSAPAATRRARSTGRSSPPCRRARRPRAAHRGRRPPSGGRPRGCRGRPSTAAAPR